MTDFLVFLKENWQLLVDAVALLFSIVFCLVKKRPCVNQMDSIKEYILEMLPVLIDSVEVEGQGIAKKYKVTMLVHDLVSKRYKIQVPEELRTFISESIENILSTPEKKR